MSYSLLFFELKFPLFLSEIVIIDELKNNTSFYLKKLKFLNPVWVSKSLNLLIIKKKQSGNHDVKS